MRARRVADDFAEELAVVNDGGAPGPGGGVERED
jgi:hypothetical protein